MRLTLILYLYCSIQLSKTPLIAQMIPFVSRVTRNLQIYITSKLRTSGVLRQTNGSVF